MSMTTPRLLGHYVETQAEGAIPNGERIRKCFSEKGDANPVGTFGKVIGSIGPAEFLGCRYGYFVVWDSMPTLAVFVVDKKIERA